MNTLKLQLFTSLAFCLVVNTAMADHTTFSSADGFSYRFDPGSGGTALDNINKSGFTDPISEVYTALNGSRFSGAVHTTNGETSINTNTISGLDITQVAFFPSTENFSRYVTTFTNNSAVDITVDVAIDGAYSGSSVAYLQSSDGNTTLDTADVSHIVAYNLGMHVVNVYGSEGAAEAVDTVNGADGTSTFDVIWEDVVVPAGNSVGFMYFIVGADDLTVAQERLLSVSGLGGLALQDVDIAKIVNWDFSDEDSDGIPDIIETALGLNPADGSDAAGDLDGDGLSNLAEYNGTTKIDNADTDGDGLNDGDEVNKYKTNPNVVDTDGDGIDDKTEVSFNKDPLDPSDGIIKSVTNGADPDYEQHQPQVATDALGRHHITWIEYNEVTTDTEIEEEGDVRYKLLAADYSTLIDTTNITSNSDVDQGHPSITIDANNIAYVFWFESDNYTGLAIAIDPSKHALDGSVGVLATLKAFTDAAADADGIISGITNMKRTSSAVDSNGLIHVASSDDNGDIGYVVFDSTGAISTAAFQPFSVDVETCCATSQLRMALDSNNKGHIVWSSGSDEIHYGMVDGVAGTTLIDATLLNESSDNAEQHPSISVDSSNKVYIVWGDNDNQNDNDGTPLSTVMFGSLDPSLDDRNGDAATLATLGFTPKVIVVEDSNPWYMHSNLTADNEITITYNTGNGEGLSPLKVLQIDGAGTVTQKPFTLMAAGPKNYNSFSNYAYVNKSGHIVYANDADPKNIKIVDANSADTTVLAKASFIEAVKKVLDFGSFGSFALLGLFLAFTLRLIYRKS